jgi:hypothetical protein
MLIINFFILEFLLPLVKLTISYIPFFWLVKETNYIRSANNVHKYTKLGNAVNLL